MTSSSAQDSGERRAGVAAAAHAAAPSWFDVEDAPATADIESCIHCGLCLTACPTYRELKIEPDSPRGRIYLMRGLAEGRIQPNDPLVGHLDLCLDCRACETVCPAGVPYSRMLEETRGQLNRRVLRGSPARMLGEWALRTLFPHRGRMHAAADLLRLGQRGPVPALMRSGLAERVLPEFARKGYAMTPPIASRSERAIERLRSDLPERATFESRPDAWHVRPSSTPKARVAFFTTCVMDVLFPRETHDAIRLLAIAGAEVVVPKQQGCCGALHAHSGLRREAKALARDNVKAFEFDADYIVTHSAGCGAALRDTGHLLHGDESPAAAERFSSRVRDVSEVLDTLGLPAPDRPLASKRDPAQPLRVGYHDPCHLAHAQKVRASPRRLLASLPGVDLVDLPNADWCCGSAGVYNLSHPDMANLQLERKLDSIRSVNAEVVVASNPGCLMHMTRGEHSRGTYTPIVHLVEVLARAYPRAETTRSS